MLPWLAQACRAAREDKGRLQVHIAAAASIDQASVARFERAVAWPRDPDRLLAAYASDLDVPEVELWKRALELWRASAG